MYIETQSFFFTCPRCRSELAQTSPEEYSCSTDRLYFRRQDGIWRFLLPEREEYFGRFIKEYELVRQLEGRGSMHSAYYRSLPFTDLTGVRTSDWLIRARSFQTFVDRILGPLEAEQKGPLKIIDAGAGNAWLSYRLSQRGHQVAAVDLLVNPKDGLGAHWHYDAPFTPIQAEFDRLPFLDRQFDLLIYNASFHYALDYDKVIQEGVRVLKTEGALVIMDTPIYRDKSSGARMVHEREAEFNRQFGFPSNALPSQNFLTYAQLQQLSEAFSLTCRLLTPAYGLRWRLRPTLARIKGRREPARFHVIVLQIL